MASYIATLTGETSCEQPLSKRGIHVLSIPFWDEQDPKKAEKKIKFQAFLTQLNAAGETVDRLSTGDLNQFNYQIFGDTPEASIDLATDKENGELAQLSDVFQTQTNLGTIYTMSDLQTETQKAEEYIHRYYNENTAFNKMIGAIVSEKLGLVYKNLKNTPDKSILPSEKILELLIAYVKKECALVLALRMRGYDSIFYAANMNEATKHVAEMNCDAFQPGLAPLQVYCTVYNKVAEAAKKSSIKKTKELSSANTFFNQKFFGDLSANSKLFEGLSKNSELFALYLAFFNSTAPIEAKLHFLYKKSEALKNPLKETEPLKSEKDEDNAPKLL